MSAELSRANASKREQQLLAIVGVVVLLAFAPFLYKLGARLWAAEHYSFFPLYLGALAFIAWHRLREGVEFKPDFGLLSALRWVFPIVCVCFAITHHSPWTAGIGFLFAIRAAALACGGRALFREIRGIWWCLWLCLPLPFNLDQYLIIRMQHMASFAASRVLDWLGMQHLLTGVLIQFPEKTFFVEEACSGVQSLYASVAAVLIYSVAFRRGFIRTFLLLLCCLFWVLVANVARILAVTIAEIRYSIPLGEGWAHDATGFAVFAAVILLTMSADRFMVFLLPERLPTFGHETPPTERFALLGKLRGVGLPAVPLLGTLAVVFAGLSVWWVLSPSQERLFKILPRDELQVTAEALPAQLGEWRLYQGDKYEPFELKQRSPDHVNGEVSRIWTFEKDGLIAHVSLDGPFTMWHDLGWCYLAQGWKIESSRDEKGESHGREFTFTEMNLEDEAGVVAYVVFAAVDEQGDPVPPPAMFRLGVGMRFPELTGDLSNALAKLGAGDQRNDASRIYQMQLYGELPAGTTDNERQEMKTLLRLAAGLISANALAGEGVPTPAPVDFDKVSQEAAAPAGGNQ